MINQTRTIKEGSLFAPAIVLLHQYVLLSPLLSSPPPPKPPPPTPFSLSLSRSIPNLHLSSAPTVSQHTFLLSFSFDSFPIAARRYTGAHERKPLHTYTRPHTHTNTLKQTLIQIQIQIQICDRSKYLRDTHTRHTQPHTLGPLYVPLDHLASIALS